MIFRMIMDEIADWKRAKEIERQTNDLFRKMGEEYKMNKDIERKLEAWKTINQPDLASLCMVFGLTLEEMAEAAEMWMGRKTQPKTENRTIVDCRWPGYKVHWQENYNQYNWEQWEFETIKDWFDWMINRSSSKAILNGQLIVGNWSDNNYKVGDKLKIKIPDGEYNLTVKDDKLLTRQEAIDIYQNGRYTSKGIAETAINAYVALGMLKLKEEKPVTFEFLDDDARAIKEAEFVVREKPILSSQSLLIVIQNLLNIIKRQK